jgi:hypothetical protein
MIQADDLDAAIKEIELHIEKYSSKKKELTSH